jgi:hypothetical protein
LDTPVKNRKDSLSSLSSCQIEKALQENKIKPEEVKKPSTIKKVVLGSPESEK